MPYRLIEKVQYSVFNRKNIGPTLQLSFTILFLYFVFYSFISNILICILYNKPDNNALNFQLVAKNTQLLYKYLISN